MKRKEFKITSSEGQVEVKFAWNSSLKAIRDLLREHIKGTGEQWTMVEFEVTGRNKDNGKSPEHGYQIWESDAKGQRVTFYIDRVA